MSRKLKSGKHRRPPRTTEPLPFGQGVLDKNHPDYVRLRNAAKAARKADRLAKNPPAPPLPEPVPVEKPKRKAKSTYHVALGKKVYPAGYVSYDAYVKSEHWQDLRRRLAESWGSSRCVGCDHPVTSLHHIDYAGVPDQELLHQVVLLCSRCHTAVHRRHAKDKLPVVQFRECLRRVFAWSQQEVDAKLGTLIELAKAADSGLETRCA